MSADEPDLIEFKAEAFDLLNEAEVALLEIEKGMDFLSRYNAIFRCFHSLKGAAGMLELQELRLHMHNVEDLFSGLKDCTTLPLLTCSFFLESIDASKKILDGETVDFEYSIPSIEVINCVVATAAVEIFIIDDEKDLVEILGAYLTKGNITWRGFTDPHEAYKELLLSPPSLVISDIQMPGLTGMELLSKVRMDHPELPFIFISAHISKENLLEASSRGVSVFIEKPFKQNHVIAQVSQALLMHESAVLLNKTIDVLMFQMTELEAFLLQKGKNDVYDILKQDVIQLLAKRRELKKFITKKLAP